jgi:hypothetical protein
MRDLYEWEFHLYQDNRTFGGFFRRSAEKIALLWSYYLGPVLTIPLLTLPWMVRDRRMRFPLLALSVFLLGLAVEVFTLPHYFAPATGWLYLVLVQGLRHLRLLRWRRRPVGIAWVRAVPVLCLAMVILRVAAAAAHAPVEPAWPRGNLERAEIQRILESSPGRHLVLVQYGRTHDPHKEWVYNAADIDATKVVWARDMGEADNAEVLRYFKDRQVWLLKADENPARLERYPARY